MKDLMIICGDTAYNQLHDIVHYINEMRRDLERQLKELEDATEERMRKESCKLKYTY